MRSLRGLRLEFANGGGCAAFSVAFEQLAAGLHQHDYQSRNRLLQHDGGTDGKRRNDIACEVSAQHAAHGFPNDRHTRQYEQCDAGFAVPPKP